MSMAALVGVVGAVFALLDALSKPDEQTKVRDIFQQYWETVRRTSLLSMPGRLVRLILSVRHFGEAVTEWVVTSDRGSTIVGSIGGITAVIVLLIGLPRARPYIVGWSLVSLLANWSKARNWRIIGALGLLDDLGGFLIAVGGFVVLIKFATTERYTLWATLLVLIALPLGPAAMDFVDGWRRALKGSSSEGEREERPLLLQSFGIGVSLSALWTTIALVLGRFADPSASLHLSYQILSSNVAFDSLTVTLTFMLFAWVEKSRLSIAAAIAINVVVSAFFACASLWLGLYCTPARLSVHQIFHVLVARSPDGSRFQLSSYFFLMHTTFLPIAIFFSLIFLCWIAKTMLQVSLWIMKRGADETVNPLKMCAALCAVFVALFAGMVSLAGELCDRAKAYEKDHNKDVRPAVIYFAPAKPRLVPFFLRPRLPK